METDDSGGDMNVDDDHGYDHGYDHAHGACACHPHDAEDAEDEDDAGTYEAVAAASCLQADVPCVVRPGRACADNATGDPDPDPNPNPEPDPEAGDDADANGGTCAFQCTRRRRRPRRADRRGAAGRFWG